jgi:hypothetical protein
VEQIILKTLLYALLVSTYPADWMDTWFFCVFAGTVYPYFADSCNYCDLVSYHQGRQDALMFEK